MSTTTNVKQLKMNIMTQQQYTSATKNANELYMVTDADLGLADKDLSNLSATGESHFQAPLISGTNIKTINNTNILGSGNIDTSDIFIAQYEITSYTDITTAINNGKLVLCTYNGSTYYYDGSGGGFVSFVTNTVGTNYIITVDSSNNWANDSREFPTLISELTDNTSSYPIDKAKSVVDQNSGSVKMWTGTQAQYNNIATKDSNTIYYITDD